MRRMLAQLTTANEEFILRGCFATAQEALDAIPGLDVGVVLSEMALPDLCGPRCAWQLLAVRPELRVIIVSAIRHPLLVRAAVAAGASEYLVKPVTASQCLATLRFVAWQEPVPWAEAKGRSPSKLPPEHLLGPRELQVLELAAEGAIGKEIADRLGVSGTTVHTYWQRIFVKLGVHTRAAAVARFPGLAVSSKRGT